MEKCKVGILNSQKAVKVPQGMRLLIRRTCHAVLELEGFEEPCEVSVTFVDNAEIHRLNLEFRGIDRATDVLSFPTGDPGEYEENLDTGRLVLGDVIISLERAMEQAEDFGHSIQREVAFLTAHSVLHLLGYDHVDGGLEEVRMREKEEQVMLRLGLPRDASFVMEE